jgi:hypothetical protein
LLTQAITDCNDHFCRRKVAGASDQYAITDYGRKRSLIADTRPLIAVDCEASDQQLRMHTITDCQPKRSLIADASDH